MKKKKNGFKIKNERMSKTKVKMKCKMEEMCHLERPMRIRKKKPLKQCGNNNKHSRVKFIQLKNKLYSTV